jgi:hypothetical protein
MLPPKSLGGLGFYERSRPSDRFACHSAIVRTVDGQYSEATEIFFSWAVAACVRCYLDQGVCSFQQRVSTKVAIRTPQLVNIVL